MPPIAAKIKGTISRFGTGRFYNADWFDERNSRRVAKSVKFGTAPTWAVTPLIRHKRLAMRRYLARTSECTIPAK
jgi:hypothetical protein